MPKALAYANVIPDGELVLVRIDSTWAARPPAADYPGAWLRLLDTIFAGTTLVSDGADWVPMGKRARAVFVGDTPNHTGTLAQSGALDTRQIPAGFCNINGVEVRVSSTNAFTGTAGTKTQLIKIGGVSISDLAASASFVSARIIALLEVTGTGSNFTLPITAASSGYITGSSAGLAAPAIDFAAAQDVTWHFTLGSAADSAISRRRSIEVLFP